MKILWASNGPNVPTGYGVPTRYILPYLQEAGHEVAIQAFYGIQGGGVEWNGVHIYPGHGSPYGVDVISHHAKHFGADLVVTLMDNWVFPDWYSSVFDAKWLSWFPVDGAPVPQRSIDMANLADYPAVFSRFGVDELMKVGVNATYLPYAVDCVIFRPGDKSDARKQIGVPDDVFLVVTVAANQGYPARKAWPEILMGFKKFLSSHPNARLHLHTRLRPISELGIDFDPLVRDLRLEKEVSFANSISIAVGVPNEELAVLYQAADVMLLPSMGEGFGLPIAEAQACGCPVITQACSSMTELTIFGMCIKPLQPFWIPKLNYWWQLPSVDRIAIALTSIYEDSKSPYTQNSSAAASKYFRNNYDWPVIFERYWNPLLETIESELQ